MRDQDVTGKNIPNVDPTALIRQAMVDASDDAIHMPGDVLFLEESHGSKHRAPVVTKLATTGVAPVHRLVEQVHLNKKINPAVPKA